jgi:hypothetical protein
MVFVVRGKREKSSPSFYWIESSNQLTFIREFPPNGERTLRGGVNIRHTNFFRAESKKKTKNLRKLMI